MNRIEKHIRRIALRHMVFPVFLLAVIAALFHFLPFSEVFHPETIESLASIDFQYENKEPYVTLTCDRLNYTGYDYYVSGAKAGSYYYTFLDDTCYFVLIRTADYNILGIPGEQTAILSETLTDYQVTGKILKISRIPEELFTGMAEDLGWTYDGLTAVCNTCFLSECTFDMQFYTYLRIGLLAAALFFGAVLLIYLIWLVNPWTYTGVLHLLRYGSIRGQLKRANGDLASDAIVAIGDVRFTPNFYIEFGKNKLIVMPLKRIIWIYRIGTMQRFLFVRLTVSYRIYLHGRGHVTLTSEQMDADASISITRFLKTNRPDLLVGYSDSNRRLAKEIDAGRKQRKKKGNRNE